MYIYSETQWNTVEHINIDHIFVQQPHPVHQSQLYILHMQQPHLMYMYALVPLSGLVAQCRWGLKCASLGDYHDVAESRGMTFMGGAVPSSIASRVEWQCGTCDETTISSFQNMIRKHVHACTNCSTQHTRQVVSCNWLH